MPTPSRGPPSRASRSRSPGRGARACTCRRRSPPPCSRTSRHERPSRTARSCRTPGQTSCRSPLRSPRARPGSLRRHS
ncbi:hypothetical protein PybrP1_012698 [[Pythium] brassicae (nom. inval.)]|nr:hypothetical protein PybrP1_012698 [[Pythium] brassicae (nom. inval.)]